MLTEIRDRSSGWFAWVIAALIIIPMAFWGVQEYASTEANPSLVEVGDQKITQSQYQAQLNNEQQRIRQALGSQADNNFLTSDSNFILHWLSPVLTGNDVRDNQRRLENDPDHTPE